MNDIQVAALKEIERQISLMWAAEAPPGPKVYQAKPTDDLQKVLDTVDADIVDLGGLTFVRGTLNVERKIDIRNGVIQATPNTNTLVNITGTGVGLNKLMVRGDGTTQRGIAANGNGMQFEDIAVLNICRPGIETNAVACWNGQNLTIKNSTLQGGSQAILFGGASPTIPNFVPTNILLDNVVMSRPDEWRLLSYACKTGLEVKSGRNITVRNCAIKNVWTQGQTGIAVTLTPSQYGNSPECQIENLLFEKLWVENVGGGVSILGYTQHSEADRQTLQTTNVVFMDCVWDISRAVNGGQGALLQIGKGPLRLAVINNTVKEDGGAFIRVTDTKPSLEFEFRGNSVNTAGTYGIFAPNGNIRGIGKDILFPGGDISENTFVSAHATFRANFPDNTYVV